MSLSKGQQLVIVSSYDLLNELCDDQGFPKLVSRALKEISALVHDGLFTYVTFTLPQSHHVSSHSPRAATREKQPEM